MKKSTVPRPSNAVLRETMIREAAYFRAEHRAFAPGKELEDWIAAEQEVDALLTRDVGGSAARKSRANTAKSERRAS
jgi:hypothetical protein